MGTWHVQTDGKEPQSLKFNTHAGSASCRGQINLPAQHRDSQPPLHENTALAQCLPCTVQHTARGRPSNRPHTHTHTRKMHAHIHTTVQVLATAWFRRTKHTSSHHATPTVSPSHANMMVAKRELYTKVDCSAWQLTSLRQKQQSRQTTGLADANSPTQQGGRSQGWGVHNKCREGRGTSTVIICADGMCLTRQRPALLRQCRW